MQESTVDLPEVLKLGLRLVGRLTQYRHFYISAMVSVNCQLDRLRNRPRGDTSEHTCAVLPRSVSGHACGKLSWRGPWDENSGSQHHSLGWEPGLQKMEKTSQTFISPCSPILREMWPTAPDSRHCDFSTTCTGTVRWNKPNSPWVPFVTVTEKEVRMSGIWYLTKKNPWNNTVLVKVL